MKYCLLLFSILIGLNLDAQTITDKEIKSYGYGEKKFKKAPKKVFITGFDVYYQMTASAKASVSSNQNFSKGASSAAMTIAVKGVDVPELTKITNEVYEDFIKDLKNKGFEIIPGAAAANTKFYEGRQMLDGNMNSSQLPGYIKATPEGFQYFVKRITKKGKEKTGLLPINAKLSKQLDDAVLIHVTYNFQLFDVSASKSGALGIAKVKGKVDFKLRNAAVYIGYGNPAGLAFDANIVAELKKPIPIEGVFYNEDEKFKQVALGSYSPSFAGFMTGNHKQITHQAECDTEKYIQITSTLMKQYVGLAMTDFYANIR